MTEEEIKALQEKNSEYETKLRELMASVEELSVERQKDKENLNKVVDELKTERKKKQEALDKTNIIDKQPDVETLVLSALEKRQEEERKRQLDEALEEFKRSKPEFQADPSGLVYSKFEKVLADFNLSSAQTKESMKAKLDMAYKFSKFKETSKEEPEYDGTPQTKDVLPKEKDMDNIEIEKTLESTRVSKESFAKLKSKYPEALEGLGIRN